MKSAINDADRRQDERSKKKNEIRKTGHTHQDNKKAGRINKRRRNKEDINEIRQLNKT